MTVPIDLTDYLSRLRTQVCGRYEEGWSVCPGRTPATQLCAEDPDLLRSIASTRAGRENMVAAFRARLQEMRCQQCVFLLLLQAIARTIPAAEVAAWMEAPNEDLRGKTPLACINAGDFEPVFESLWLMTGLGPSS